MLWQDKNGELYQKFEFEDFKEAFEFMKQVAEAAEEQNHHPRWQNEYNKVEIWLSTHSAGGLITDKDKRLASEIDRVYKKLID